MTEQQMLKERILRNTNQEKTTIVPDPQLVEALFSSANSIDFSFLNHQKLLQDALQLTMKLLDLRLLVAQVLYARDEHEQDSKHPWSQEELEHHLRAWIGAPRLPTSLIQFTPSQLEYLLYIITEKEGIVERLENRLYTFIPDNLPN